MGRPVGQADIHVYMSPRILLVERNRDRPDTRYTAPLVVLAGAFVAAGGYVHLREWFETYRLVPSTAAGAAVVRMGFPVNAAASAVFAVLLGVSAFRSRRPAGSVVAGAVLLQAGSLRLCS